MSGPPAERARADAPPPRGVLRARVPGGETEHLRVLPHASLRGFVAHFWWVRWALAEPFTTETLPHPSVHVVLEEADDGEERRSRAEIAGVSTGRFVRRLAGRGEVFGIKFRPATFQPLLGAAMSTLTDRVVPVSAVLGDDGDRLARACLDARDLPAKIAIAEAFLARRLPPLTSDVEALRDLVERMAVDRALLRVEDVAAEAGVTARALQRRFRHGVGVSPKWVLQRYRLHEAAERLKGPDPPSIASLAAELGYADQAHLARDFRRVIGRTPGHFVAMEGVATRPQ